jgi:nucleotide-binding universal stress UspA family protein
MVAKKVLSAGARNFLVPTDFSDCAKKAAEEAVTLAQSFSGRVIFLHVIDLYPFYGYPYAGQTEVFVPITPPTPEELESEWQAFLSGLPLEDVAWEKSNIEGEPAETILRQAKIEQTDLIVMGTHGRTGLEHMLLGSVAEKVVRSADHPILTIRPEAFQFEMP